jgi:hypothetical protein
MCGSHSAHSNFVFPQIKAIRPNIIMESPRHELNTPSCVSLRGNNISCQKGKQREGGNESDFSVRYRKGKAPPVLVANDF